MSLHLSSWKSINNWCTHLDSYKSKSSEVSEASEAPDMVDSSSEEVGLPSGESISNSEELSVDQPDSSEKSGSVVRLRVAMLLGDCAVCCFRDGKSESFRVEYSGKRNVLKFRETRFYIMRQLAPYHPPFIHRQPVFIHRQLAFVDLQRG